ncbi:MAG: LPS-assembly protein LptD [Chitinophagales bacterium]|nr:LPS-assembly protein LptD [Chitinophagales bacterium]
MSNFLTVSAQTNFEGATEADSLAGKSKIRIGNDSLSRIASDTILLSDTVMMVADSVSLNDTISLEEKGEIEDIIQYQAEDSMVYDMDAKKLFLYNGSDVAYQKIKLQSRNIDFDWNTFTLFARGGADSLGNYADRPIFKDGDKEYHADSMAYNFKTKKGKIYKVTTHEGDAYIHSEMVKKNEYDEWFGKSSMYTTCDLDHPHFYFKARKVKIVPSKVMVAGPVNLWVADVPTPLALPFAMFPVKQGRRSGLVMPEYGQDAVFGFFLRNGGYYWALNDYASLKFTGQVGTNGTFGAGVAAQYALRYKFSGNLSFYYLRSQPFDPDLPGAKASNSYNVSWTHTQDPRSIPNSTFGASVQMQSADYYNASRNVSTDRLNTSFNSGVNFSHNFRNSPFSLSINLRHTQNLLNRTIGFTLPVVRLSMSRVAPFKSKIQTGKPKWYESIGFSYSFEFQNQLNTSDSTLFRYSTLDKFRFGINQNFQVDAPITVFKYLNINPAFSYQERTYFKGISKTWNPDTIYTIKNDGTVDTIYGRVITDTSWRFNSSRNFQASLSFSTKVIGIFKFKSKWLKAIKHVFTPTVSFNYRPDFSTRQWGFYRTVQGDRFGTPQRYSVFEPDAVYGFPGAGQEGSIVFGLLNNFEMKVFSKKDSVNNEKKVGLLDQVNITGGYNFVADSLRLLPFNLSVVSSRIFNLINLNFNAVFDPYATDSFNRRINTFQYDVNRRLLRFSTANISASTSLHSKPRNPGSVAVSAPPAFMGDYVSYNPNQVYDFDIPWSINLSYRFNLTRGTTFNPDTILTVQSLNVSADFNITPKWKVAISSGFDITRKQLTLTNVSVVRDLHCWELNFAWTPPLPYGGQNFQQFTILLQPKSGTLRDLKIQRKNQLGQEF